ncbi:MAG: lipoyl synthase [Pirellulaceae bacterium]|nr:lipoyl synthase [Pirellulaceae bacterium]
MPHDTGRPELPILTAPPAAGRLPRWLKRPVPKGNFRHFTAAVVEDLALETVCDHARCPNRMECYAHKTATFMILGDICTRACSFCSVSRGRPQRVDPDEPRRVAEAARRLDLRHVVITSVTRDDLADGGAAHFVACIRAVRQVTGASVEVLTPDFRYDPAAIDAVADAAPEVFNHNTETVPRLYRQVRGPQAAYRGTLALLRRVQTRDPRIKVKSGLMLGLGESRTELLETLADLLDHGCEYLTLGQYLQPDPTRYLPVARYLPPEEFEELGRIARQLGFARVASGPFVRSSYHARDMALPA